MFQTFKLSFDADFWPFGLFLLYKNWAIFPTFWSHWFPSPSMFILRYLWVGRYLWVVSIILAWKWDVTLHLAKKLFSSSISFVRLDMLFKCLLPFYPLSLSLTHSLFLSLSYKLALTLLSFSHSSIFLTLFLTPSLCLTHS